ncbi:DUF3108 domain-containing protein [Mangrovimonas sp. AS39]|uniref:DUF3108 domain-containing protein n=1 Tax=Mangrovimonas futianensis TaxID=2895523 RepID=UPI001E64804D|nr:DUF3108 domain-containing protein [Mangrovimonas futianensis]MCF1192734.1 DUF3108 domain-containing protein [Mangrovimonas futianensis]MCF1196345.1 DUF3108 domain-containing protein [Mangrovimonas futianensis]
MQRLLILALILFHVSLFSQNTAIGTSEKLVFTASYNMSGILTDLAEVKMETSPVKTSKTTLLRLKCTATTYSKWDSFFKIRDLYESYVSPRSLTPYLYKRDIDEGGYYKFMQYTFSHKTHTVKSLKKKRNGKGEIWEEKKNVSIGASTRDIVSTIYNIRNIDFSQFQKGTSKTYKVIFDNKEHVVNIKNLGQEQLSTALGSKMCHKLSISMNNDVLKGSNDNLLWLTADANKIPVFAKFKIAVGNGELKIKFASGLKN